MAQEDQLQRQPLKISEIKPNDELGQPIEANHNDV